jgi:hypothetical protein
VMQYYTSDSDPDFKYCPFPRLSDIRKQLLKDYYEAEFNDQQDIMDKLKVKINCIEIAINLGEEYDIPF